ncbi:MAG: hypothetical protein PUC32_00890 [Oscillospiraceae bacterium]|nr:hypothetical protein [Oscillospiraceae bacterium]
MCNCNNDCSWIFILLIIILFCGNGFNCGNNGCGNNGCGNDCGCGC